jgi:type III pantothenate kinase
MIGARAEFNGEIAIIDAGTAVTIDFVNKKGVHIGGQILPGLHLMLKALDDSTRNISTSGITEDILQREIDLWAKDTTSAVISGAYNALCGAIIRSVSDLRKMGFKPKVILTGGDARFLMNFLDKSYLYRPNLVLNGLASIARGGD